MNWLLVGHGALASLWAHHLSAQSNNVRLITRGINAATSSTPTVSLSIDTLDGTTETREFTTCHWGNLSRYITRDTCILVLVKAWQLQSVIEQLAAALDRSSAPARDKASAISSSNTQYESVMPQAIILSHNGLGAAEALLNQKLQQGWPIFDLVTTHGAWRKSQYHVVHGGAGSSAIGPRQQPADNTCMAPPYWLEHLAAALPPLQWEPDILLRRWQKLAINCAINPLATLAGQTNGILRQVKYQADIKAICEEIAMLASEVLGPSRLTAEALLAQVQQVIAATANNTCSMLQDVQHGNPTEIQYLNGYVAQLAHQLGLQAPVNQRLTTAIQQL